MNIYCPKHPKEPLRSLIIHIKDTDKRESASTKKTGYFYCVKCDKPYKPKVIFT